VQHGVALLQDLDSNVYALALNSGKLEWQYRCDALRSAAGRDPTAWAVADGRVYGETPTSVFAVSAASRSGKAIWVSSTCWAAARERSGFSRKRPMAACIWRASTAMGLAVEC
jgi:outer membrane protein assembly factor BamB